MVSYCNTIHCYVPHYLTLSTHTHTLNICIHACARACVNVIQGVVTNWQAWPKNVVWNMVSVEVGKYFSCQDYIRFPIFVTKCHDFDSFYQDTCMSSTNNLLGYSELIIWNILRGETISASYRSRVFYFYTQTCHFYVYIFDKNDIHLKNCTKLPLFS